MSDVQLDFLADFADLSTIGVTGHGGVDREAATASDGQTRRWLQRWLDAHGLTVRVDAVGNLYGSVEWTPGAPYVLVGSHLDSQPTAGRFDGAYGVLAAAHAAAQAKSEIEAGDLVPAFNLAVVDWFNEEGSRFQPSLMGSGVYAGKLTAQKALDTTDLAGISVRAALADIGFAGNAVPPVAAAYAEIHVEQGRLLEDSGTDIGMVTANWSVRKYSVTVQGEQGHTGATAMADRHDALFGAAQVVIAVRALAARFALGQLLTTSGQLLIEPNSPGVITSRVQIAVDVRSPSPEVLQRAHVMFEAALADITAAGEVAAAIDECALRPSTSYPRGGVILAEAVADELGLSHLRLETRAGHDSVSLKDVVPTVMLFVPSEGGVSHHEAERTADADLLKGVRLLAGVVLRLVAGDGIDEAVAGGAPLEEAQLR